jgi:hypothetical protein
VVWDDPYQFTTVVWCPGDVSGAGVVNVEDLLAVIGAWGACPASPAACPADIAPQPCGNDAVNVSDLLAVIGSWGCQAPGCTEDVAPEFQTAQDCFDFCEANFDPETQNEKYQECLNACFELLP